jgi:hypothetical protein
MTQAMFIVSTIRHICPETDTGHVHCFNHAMIKIFKSKLELAPNKSAAMQNTIIEKTQLIHTSHYQYFCYIITLLLAIVLLTLPSSPDA